MGSTKLAAVVLGTLLSISSANLLPRVLNDPVGLYLTSMCYPLYSNHTRAQALGLSINGLAPSLANSPFPCEQELYIQSVCSANGTTPADFLAEQQCLCNGAFFEVMAGCYDCQIAHGNQKWTPEQASSTITSLSSAECSPSPPIQPYSNYLPPISLPNRTEISLRPSITLGNDQFPSNTEVSNYFTRTGTVLAGEITGSATARLTSWTNWDGVRFTPTTTPSSSTAPGTVTTTSPSTTSSSSSASSIVESGNAAAIAVQTHPAVKLLAVAMGLAVVL